MPRRWSHHGAASCHARSATVKREHMPDVRAGSRDRIARPAILTHVNLVLRQFLLLAALTAALLPCVLAAQSREKTTGWAIAASIGAGVADVPTSPTPVYFDASQVTARLAVQRSLGAGFAGGISLLGTIGTTGSDCALGPCAPQFRQSAASATITYIHRASIERWIPIVSLAAGYARLPEQWAAAPETRTPAAGTLLLSGALDVPLVIRSRSAVLVGWESSVLPNAPGDRIAVNTIVFTVRHALRPRSAR